MKHGEKLTYQGFEIERASNGYLMRPVGSPASEQYATSLRQAKSVIRAIKRYLPRWRGALECRNTGRLGQSQHR